MIKKFYSNRKTNVFQTKKNTKKCIVTGNNLEKEFMFKFVLSPEGNIIPDLNEKLPGNNFWISSKREIMIEAQKKETFKNFFKIENKKNKNILNDLIFLLKKRIIQRVSLARKSSYAICGYQKIKSALSQNKIGLLIQALDGSKKEKNRLRGNFNKKFQIECLKSSEIGVAFGRDYIVHAGILTKGYNEKFKNDVQKLNNLIS